MSTAQAQLLTKGREFAAPLVSSHLTLPGDIPFGSIIYDNTVGSFMGLGGNGVWQTFGTTGSAGESSGANTALSNLTDTAINTDIFPAIANTINVGNPTDKQFLSIHAKDATFDDGGINIGRSRWGYPVVSADAFYGPTEQKGLIFKAQGSSPHTYLYLVDGSNLVLAPVNGGVLITPSHIRSAADVYAPAMPTADVTANAGSSGSCTIANFTDVAGEITITTDGSGLAAGDVCNLNFGQAFVTAPICSLTPANANAASNTTVTFLTRSTTAMTINFANAGAAATSYTYNYFCIETQ